MCGTVVSHVCLSPHTKHSVCSVRDEFTRIPLHGVSYTVGFSDGSVDGVAEGTAVGSKDGAGEGKREGSIVTLGWSDGNPVGALVGQSWSTMTDPETFSFFVVETRKETVEAMVTRDAAPREVSTITEVLDAGSIVALTPFEGTPLAQFEDCVHDPDAFEDDQLVWASSPRTHGRVGDELGIGDGTPVTLAVG